MPQESYQNSYPGKNGNINKELWNKFEERYLQGLAQSKSTNGVHSQREYHSPIGWIITFGRYWNRYFLYEVAPKTEEDQ